MTRRVIWSTPPPGGNGTMTWTGRSRGHSVPCARAGMETAAAASVTRDRRFSVILSSSYFFLNVSRESLGRESLRGRHAAHQLLETPPIGGPGFRIDQAWRYAAVQQVDNL